MPDIPDFPELFPIPVVYYGVTDDPGKIMEKFETNESKNFPITFSPCSSDFSTHLHQNETKLIPLALNVPLSRVSCDL